MAGRRPDDAADELYGLAPADFTKARDALARRLRQEGRRDEADAVKSLRKPTVPAWALNQLARRRPQDVKRLLAIGDRLRKAQDALLAGKDRSSLKRVSAEERELVDELTRDATAVAGEAGGATASIDERIRATLHAAALDEHTARDLAAGRLVREREAVGLFGGSEVSVAPAEPARGRQTKGGREPRQDAERRREAKRELAASKSEQQKAQRAHASAAQTAERARKRADDAQRRADEARERAAQASAALRDAERKERDAARARDNAARAVAAAEKRIR